MIVTSTWMPRRLRAASLRAVREHLVVVAAVAEVDEHGVVLRLVVDHRLRDRHLVRGGEVEPLLAAEGDVDDDPEQQPADAEQRSRVGYRTAITTNAMQVNVPPTIANSGAS